LARVYWKSSNILIFARRPESEVTTLRRGEGSECGERGERGVEEAEKACIVGINAAMGEVLAQVEDHWLVNHVYGGREVESGFCAYCSKLVKSRARVEDSMQQSVLLGK